MQNIKLCSSKRETVGRNETTHSQPLKCYTAFSSLFFSATLASGPVDPQPQLACVLQLYFKTPKPYLQLLMRHISTYMNFFFCCCCWLCRMACRILLPRPGIVLMPPALRVWSLDHQTSRKVPRRTLELLSPFENFQDPKPQFQVPAVHFLCDPPRTPTTPSGLCGHCLYGFWPPHN